MAWPDDVREKALIACGRCCCICHKFCGLKMELHHIKLESEGGEETLENCIPLCFDCHADQRSYDHKHPKGLKYTRAELQGHRDGWYAKVKASPATQTYLAAHLEADRLVFQDVVKLLPWNGSVGFLREANFAGWSFELRRLFDLDEFLHRCSDPGFEFIDADLESARASLATAIAAFSNAVVANTFPARNIGFKELPPEWEENDPDRFHQAVALLEGGASLVCESYDKLVRLGKRKLGV